MTTTNMLTINTALLIKPARDELYKKELIDQHRLIKKLKEELKVEELKRNKLSVLNAQSRGVEPAYIGNGDLVEIIQDLLTNKSTVSKAFQRHEVNKIKTAVVLNTNKKLNGFNAVNTSTYKDWAKRTMTYSVDKPALTSALGILGTNTVLMLMQKYEVLDVKDIARSASYSAALTKLKKQLHLAEQLQEKVDQLTLKDQAIAQGQQEINRLQEELVRNKSGDWKENAIRLAKAGNTVTYICKLLSLSRGTVSTYLNKPEVKLLISEQKPSVQGAKSF